MRVLKAIGIWLLSVILIVAAASTIVQTDTNIEVSMPGEYFAIVIILPIVFAVYFSKPRKATNKIKKAVRSYINKKNLNKKYDSLSEVEKWKIETNIVDKTGAVEVDDMIYQAAKVVLSSGDASTSSLQQKLGIGYCQAAQMLDGLEKLGIVGPFEGTRPRKILVTMQEHESRILRRVGSQGETNKPFSKYGGVDAELLSVDSMDGHEFEHWCADLLRKIGYHNVEVTRGSGDQGVDVLAEKDGIKYAIQCKCYSSNLGNTPVQEVHSGKALYNCQIGVVMTNRYLTAGGKELADATGVLVWDRDRIREMLEKVQ